MRGIECSTCTTITTVIIIVAIITTIITTIYTITTTVYNTIYTTITTSHTTSHTSACHLRVDMGTTDEMALDVLINALMGFSKDHLGIKKLLVGGTNDDWPVPDMGDGDVIQAGRDAMQAAMAMMREKQGKQR